MELVGAEGLAQVLEERAAQGVAPDVVVGGHQDDRHGDLALVELALQLQAGRGAHPQVHEQHVEQVRAGGQRPRDAGGSDHRVTSVVEGGLERIENVFVVVDYQDTSHD
jgi:hypothetical protein